VRASAPGEFIRLLRRSVRLAVKHELLPYACAVEISVVSNEQIRQVNKEQRGVDKETDVLSFPAWGPGEEPVPDPGTGRVYLGEILIAQSKAMNQARRNRHSPEREFGYLAAHGTLHLLGYDHDSEWNRAVMRKKEENVMERMRLLR
jgi:probable rRNA maturation factor